MENEAFIAFLNDASPEALDALFNAFAHAQIQKLEGVTIFLTRHPESLGNREGAEVYATVGDHDNPITKDTGKEQALANGKIMLRHIFPRFGITEMPQLWRSTYVRPTEGLKYALEHIRELDPNWIKPKDIIHRSDFLSERDFGLLAHAKHLKDNQFANDEFAQKIIDVSLAMNHAVYKKTPSSTTPLFGESRKETAGYGKIWKDSLYRDIYEGAKTHWVWSHGDVMKGILKSFLHEDAHSYWDSFKIGNCDTFAIHGSKGSMTIQKVIDGENMRPISHAAKYRVRAERIEDLLKPEM